MPFHIKEEHLFFCAIYEVTEHAVALSCYGSWLTFLITFQTPSINLAICSEPQTFANLILISFNQEDGVLFLWLFIMLAFTETYTSELNYNFLSR